MDVTPRAIEVRIEELILYGVSPADGLRIGAAAEQALARLLGEQGLPAGLSRGTDLEAIDAGWFTRDSLATPAGIGAEIGGAVYRGMGQ